MLTRFTDAYMGTRGGGGGGGGELIDLANAGLKFIYAVDWKLSQNIIGPIYNVLLRVMWPHKHG